MQKNTCQLYTIYIDIPIYILRNIYNCIYIYIYIYCVVYKSFAGNFLIMFINLSIK